MSLWSGLPSLISSVALADSFQDQFNKQRQIVRNLELQATKAMYAAAPACDTFEIKFNALMSAAGMILAKNPDIGPPPQTQAKPPSLGDSNLSTNYFLQKNVTQYQQRAPALKQNESKPKNDILSDKTMTVLPVTAMTVSAKEYGLDPQLAYIIDNDKKLSSLLVETQLAAGSCRPFYATSYDAEVALTNAISQWIALAQKADPVGIGSPTIEANSMWVATNIRRATHKEMHTTITEIENECSGDLFIDQSIPNLFQALARGEVSLLHKSISDIIHQSLCLDVRQSIALDRGMSLGGAGVIMAFGKPENEILRKRLLEAVLIAGAPILEVNKPLGPTGLWVLTQSLLNKQLSSPDIWVLDKESYLVTYGITVAERDSPQSAVFPICTEVAPPPSNSFAGPSVLPLKIEKANMAAIAQSSQFNLNMAAKDLTLTASKGKTTPQLITVDPNDAPLAYGYTAKSLKEMICPVVPSKIVSVPTIVKDSTLNKGLQAKYCYKADVITDSYRGDHLGYANCSLPEMVKDGRVCKRELCGDTSIPLVLPSPEDEGEMPSVETGKSCEFPTFSGVPHACKSLTGGTAKLFVHQSNNKGCGKLDPLKEPSAGAGEEEKVDYVGEEMVITGAVPSEPASSSSSSSDKPEKTLPDPYKPEKNINYGPGQQPQTQKPSAWSYVKKDILYQGIPQPKKQKFIFPKDDNEWKNFLEPYQNPKISNPQEFIAASKNVEELRELFREVDYDYNECALNPPAAGCDQLRDARDKIYPDLRVLEKIVFEAGYRHVFDPINDNQQLRKILIILRNMKKDKCGQVCDKKAADLEAYISSSDVFKKFNAEVRKAALDVLKNKKFKTALKQAREKFLGKTIDDNAYNDSYEAMLKSFPKSNEISLGNPELKPGQNFLAMGSTDENSQVSVYLASVAEAYVSPEVFKDETINVLIHENGLHVVSHQLAQYGYDFEGKPGEGAAGTHPDHEVGKILQQMTGVAMGYGDPPTTIVVTVMQTAEGELKKEASIPNYGGYKGYIVTSGSSGSSGKTASSGGKGAGSSGGGSGGGGGGNKSCGPDGCFDPCQLATMAAVAQCDMAMGKPVLNVIPGGGLIAPEKPLDQGMTDWLNCEFPQTATGYDKTDVFCSMIGGQVVCTEHTYHIPGLDDSKCQQVMCDKDSSPSINKTTGVCSCKPSGYGKGDPAAGFRGGPDDCQKVICAEDSLNPCCTGGMYRGMPGQGRGFKPETRTPSQVPTQQPHQQRQKAFGREYNTYPAPGAGSRK